MKRQLLIVLFASMIVLGGCQMNNNKDGEKPEEVLKPKDMEVEDLPKVRAFQDEFTRSFLQSTEETRPGYYPFLSGTGAFTLDFPEGGKSQEKGYRIKRKNHEAVFINIGNEASDVIHNIKIVYFGHLEEAVHKETSLGMLHSSLDSELDFERIEEANQIYYISEYEVDDEAYDDDIYGYAAYLFNKRGQGGIEIVYTSFCTRNCEGIRKQDKEKIYEWIKHVEFLDERAGSDEDES